MLAIIAAILDEQERDRVDQIFRDQFRRMERIAFDVLHNHHDAQDAAMTAILHISQHPELFVDYPTQSTLNLIFVITQNAAVDMYRKNRRRRATFVPNDDENPILERVPDDGPSLADMAVTKENQELVLRALASLDDLYRIPILMQVFHQMKNIEIAEVLDTNINTINWRIFHGRKLLKKIVKEMGYTHE